ncbi:MAG: hypothetical protein AB1758_20535 [Candidatus Eremiobacterota bacterium]
MRKTLSVVRNLGIGAILLLLALAWAAVRDEPLTEVQQELLGGARTRLGDT